MQRAAAIQRDPLLTRIATIPKAVARSSRRMGRIGLLAADTIAHVRLHRSPLTDPQQRAEELSWFAENALVASGVRLEVGGDIGTSPAIYVANHLGYLDPLAITSVVPCCPIAKEEVGNWPVVGPAAKELGVFLVRRGDSHSGAVVLRKAYRVLDAGVSVLAFPEGTTSEGHSVLPFRRGVFGLAQLTGVPIIPIALSYSCGTLCWVGDQTFLPHFLRTTARPSAVVRMRFGHPVFAKRGETPEDLAERARLDLRALMRQSQPACEMASPRFPS